eukprot:1690686-Ditylum_brightwellii.AAC.1
MEDKSEALFSVKDTGNKEEEWDHVRTPSCGLAINPPLPLLVPCANWDGLDALDMPMEVTTNC